jgi:hypothetical protein
MSISLEDMVALEDKDLVCCLLRNISQHSKVLFIDVPKPHAQESFRRVIKAVDCSKLHELRFTRRSCFDIESWEAFDKALNGYDAGVLRSFLRVVEFPDTAPQCLRGSGSMSESNMTDCSAIFVFALIIRLPNSLLLDADELDLRTILRYEHVVQMLLLSTSSCATLVLDLWALQASECFAMDPPGSFIQVGFSRS